MLGPIALTLLLAALTTLALLLLGAPLAWWLARTRSPLKPVIQAVTALPLILPPTVLGFYLLLLMSPDSPLGGFWMQVTGEALVFSFAGLWIASILYSLPFMVQPLQTAFESLDENLLRAGASLGAGPLERFTRLVLPLSVRGFVTGAALSFAHTIGEFGVVLMVGGNIPGQTRLLSIAIFEHVETLNYAEAHRLSLGLLLFGVTVLSLVYAINRPGAASRPAGG